MRLAEPRKCGKCGKEFSPLYKKRSARFCSKRCCILGVGRGEYTRERYAKVGAAQRGRGNGKAYRKYMGRHEHRVIAEQMLGRPLVKGEIVHHKDGNRLNNDPANLEVMTQSEHMKMHKVSRWSKRDGVHS